MTKTFRDLGVDGALCDALAAEGITHPFPIQELTLPLALTGNDLIGQARTGTGKTLAFGLPLLQRLDPDQKVTQALVVVPTRELCLQVHEDLKIGATKGIRSIAVYGGVGFDEQIDALTTGVHVVVGTPGRLLDHLNRGNLDLSQVTQLVLDEADEMLDMGFLPDVERLVEACTGPDRHTMLFSATMPTAIVKLARRYMNHPTFTRADTEAHETAPNVTQHFLQVHRMDKPRVLARILQTPNRGGVYVFVRTKHMADRLVAELEELGTAAVPIHGDLRQTSRERNLERFRSGKATVLVATEVAARGLDVSGVTHVVNYDCPDDEKMYLHRIGRTARAGEAGVAITFSEFNEVDKLNVIRKRVGASATQVEQVFSTSDVLTQLFDLPDERPWDHLSRTKGDGGSGGREGRSSGERSRGSTRERDRGEARGGDRRHGRSDGRPKSQRRTEGAGGDHDAKPSSERDRSSGGTSSTDHRSRSRTRKRSRTDRPRGGEDTAAPSDPPADRSSTTATSRDDRRSSTEDGSSSRQRKRARTSRTGDGPGRETTSGDAPTSREGGGGDARKATGGRKRTGATGDGGRRGGDRATAGSRRHDGDDTGSKGRSRTSGSARGRTGTRSGSSSRQQRGGGDQRQGGNQPVELQGRGRTARGEGKPQPSRRVRVEHLP